MRLSLAVLFAAILSAAAILCSCEDVLSAPIARRPERYGKDDQFSVYLKELQDYYGINGRGRYGKRQMRTITSDVYVAEVPPSPPVRLYPPYLQYRRDLQEVLRF